MTEMPLVSCIMVTADRQEFARQAIAMFRAQTWPRKELVIVDDGRAPLNPEPADDLCYIRLRDRHSIGCKRNVAAAAAGGELICHWDDDDIYAPDRIEDQVRRLQQSKASVTGYNKMVFQNEGDGSLWEYDAHRPDYAIGTSLMYTKEYWQKRGFSGKQIGEDNDFCLNRAVAVSADNRIIARVHSDNATSRPWMNNWRRIGEIAK